MMTGLGTTTIKSSSGSLVTNYARIGHAAQQVFPDILQDIITIKEPRHRLCSDVTSNRYLNRNLRPKEQLMIKNVSANGYVNFDIPLIYKLVRNLNLVPPPSKGWDFPTPPAATEILPGDDIERIRMIRNEILHRGNAKVSDTILTDYFTTFKAIAIRLESYLGKPRGEFLNKFLDLEKCCMDEDTEKTYLERLYVLKEQDNNVSKAVADIREDLDTFMYKESRQIVIEEWEEQNKLFIKTDAVDCVLESLKEKNCCTVIGSSGIGKSATIHHVALFLRDTEGYRIIPIHSPSEIDKYFQKNRKQIFVIDDICGKYTVIQTEVEKWIKRNESIQRVLKYNNIKVIASSRIQVFNEKQFKRLGLFTQRFCNLSSVEYCLSSQVKLQIARQYLSKAAVKQIENDLNNYEFLPLMFALYKSICKGNENFDVVKFFKHPFNIYTEEIDALYELLDKTKFCALFFLVIYNGSLDVSFFTNGESEQERQKREDFFEDCGIPRNTLRQRILEQLESLVPLFVRSNYDFSRQVISFSAIHNKTFDFLCFYFGNKFQKSFLRFADSEMLYERTMLKTIILPDETVAEFVILIADINEDDYFKRIIDQWSRKLYSLFYSRQMSCEKYRTKLIHYLNGLPAERRIRLITLTIENKELGVQFMHILDGCSGVTAPSPLSLAFKRNFSDVIRYILNFIHDTNGGVFSILFIKACSAGLTDVVKEFIDKGSNIHVRDTNGWTPVMVACEQGHTNIVELLLRSKANLNRILQHEEEEGVNVSGAGGHTPLIVSCYFSKIDIVRLLIEHGAIVNVFDDHGQNPLLLACENDNSDIVRLLIEKGADVNVYNNDKQTPLTLSLKHDNSSIVRLLTEKGANVNVLVSFSDTPLILSCRNNSCDIIQLLIEKGADINASNMSKHTPLLLSCEKNNSDIVRSLLKKGAHVNVQNCFGATPLLWSCMNNNIDIVRLLIEKGADVNTRYFFNETPLISSCKNNYNDIVRVLIEKGADVNVTNMSCETPLTCSCNNDNMDNVRLLMEEGADINVSNGSRETPLMLGCRNGNMNIVRLLIEKGAEINVCDYAGMSALSYASKNDFLKIVIELVLNGADIFSSDKNLKLPLMNENEHKNHKIENFLSRQLYKVHINDRKRKISEHEGDIEIIYERVPKYLKIENDKRF